MSKILIIDNETKNLNKLIKFFKKITKSNQIQVKKYYQNRNAKDFEIIILSGGSKFSVFHQPFPYSKEKKLLENLDSQKIVIGICLGFEIIAMTFSSQINQLEKKFTDTQT